LTYNEVGVCQGDYILPFEIDLDLTGTALLTRTVSEFRVLSGTIAYQYLLYKWTDDNGVQIARLVAVNDETSTNFDLNTFEITGESKLSVISDFLEIGE